MVETWLVEPSNRYKASFLKAIAEYRQIGDLQYAEAYEFAEIDFQAFLRRLATASNGMQLPKGWIPLSTFWLVDPEETLVGIIRIRYQITPSLELTGGHIRYYVPPSQRGKGYGNELLRRGLEKAQELGLRPVMLT